MRDSKETPITVVDAKLSTPIPNKIVLVCGGIAVWNGEKWLSQMPCSKDREISWDVQWWAYLPTELSYDNMEDINEEAC